MARGTPCPINASAALSTACPLAMPPRSISIGRRQRTWVPSRISISAVLPVIATLFLLSVTIFVSGRDLWAPVNAAYARMLGSHRPARAIVPVGELKPGCLIEIQGIAARND